MRQSILIEIVSNGFIIRRMGYDDEIFVFGSAAGVALKIESLLKAEVSTPEQQQRIDQFSIPTPGMAQSNANVKET